MGLKYSKQCLCSTTFFRLSSTLLRHSKYLSTDLLLDAFSVLNLFWMFWMHLVDAYSSADRCTELRYCIFVLFLQKYSSYMKRTPWINGKPQSFATVFANVCFYYNIFEFLLFGEKNFECSSMGVKCSKVCIWSTIAIRLSSTALR